MEGSQGSLLRPEGSEGGSTPGVHARGGNSMCTCSEVSLACGRSRKKTRELEARQEKKSSKKGGGRPGDGASMGTILSGETQENAEKWGAKGLV